MLKSVNSLGERLVGQRRTGLSCLLRARLQDPGGEPRSDWEAQRKARIAKPKKIEVEIEAPKVKFNDENRATVTFRQHYRSDGLKASSTKTLVLVKSGNRWLIQQEQVGS